MRQYFDVSLPYTSGLTKWPSAAKPVVEKKKDMALGADSNSSRIQASVHHGTHIDAPHHYVADGITIEALPPETLIGEVRVVDLGDATAITPAVLDSIAPPLDNERVFFKTSNSELWNDLEHEFCYDSVTVTPEGAQILVDRGVRLVGVDYLSVEEFGLEGNGTHKTLLGAEVVIVEGLDLRGIADGIYEMACLPVKIAGSDGAPARCILWRDD